MFFLFSIILTILFSQLLPHWDIFPLWRPDYLLEFIAFKRLFQIGHEETGVKGTYGKLTDFTNMSSVTISCNWIFHHVVCEAKDNIKDPYFLSLLSTIVIISCFCYILETLNVWRKKCSLFINLKSWALLFIWREKKKKTFIKCYLNPRLGSEDLGIYFFFYLLQIFFFSC